MYALNVVAVVLATATGKICSRSGVLTAERECQKGAKNDDKRL